MGSFFSQYEPGKWDNGLPSDNLGQLPDSVRSFTGGGESGPEGVKGGPGSFKRLGQGKRGSLGARGQNVIQSLSGGSGSAQASSVMDTVLARAAFNQQSYLARDGGTVQGADAGQPGNRAAFSQAANEGGEEADERGTYPFTATNNPHTRDATNDNSLALNHDSDIGKVPFPYDGDQHAHTVAVGRTDGAWEDWTTPPDPTAKFPVAPGDVRRGKYQPTIDEQHTDLQSMTPAQRLAWRLAQPDPRTTQEYPAPMRIGEGFGKL